MSTDASLPSELEACQRELLHTRSVLAETAVTCEEQHQQIEKLQAERELFQRYLFGRRSERFVEDATWPGARRPVRLRDGSAGGHQQDVRSLAPLSPARCAGSRGTRAESFDLVRD